MSLNIPKLIKEDGTLWCYGNDVKLLTFRIKRRFHVVTFTSYAVCAEVRGRPGYWCTTSWVTCMGIVRRPNLTLILLTW